MNKTKVKLYLIGISILVIGVIILDLSSASGKQNEDSMEVQREITSEDWESVGVFDWDNIELSKKEFQEYVQWLSGNEKKGTKKVEMLGENSIKVTLNEKVKETKSYELVSDIVDMRLRGAYKSSPYSGKGDTVEPKIKYYSVDGELVAEYKKSSHKQNEEEQELEQNQST